MKRFAWVTILSLAALSAAVAATRRDFTRPNLRVFVEMSDSAAYRSHSENPVLRGGQTLQPPPAGTVPRGYRAYRYEASEDDRKRAGRELKNPLATTLGALTEGHRLYDNNCLHCHGRSGRGDGAVAKRVPTFSMPISGLATGKLPDGEIFHIITHGRNNMPPHGSQIRPDDRWKIVLYLRELQREEAARLQRLGLVYEDQEDPRPYSLVSTDYGRELFQSNCASCHGAEGRNPTRGVPTLNHPRVLGVADDGFYLNIISHGRKGTAMAAYGEILTPTQLQSVVRYIRSWQPAEPDRSRIDTRLGDPVVGRAVYHGNCAACHGPAGEGGIGNSLNRPSFLAVASDTFLRDTITLGRKHTAMPAATTLREGDISDLIAYIRTWSPKKHDYAAVAKILPDASAAMGKKLYAARCASCHDRDGAGGIGPRLNSNDFLRLADDEFLYRAIVEGRPNTAMPAWHFLEARDVADLIAHLRSWQKVPPARLSKAPRKGDRPEFGEILYNKTCVQCHGPAGRGGVGPQLANAVLLDSASDEFLFHSIAYGRPGTAMRGFLKDGSAGSLMPLSANDIDNIIGYLRELQAHPSVEAPMRPHDATSITRGKEIFDRTAACAKCHGEEGEGALGPAITNPDFLRVASDGYLIGTIILGRERTEMPSFYRSGAIALSQGEVEDVVAYIRSFEHKPSVKRREVERSDSSIAEGRDLFLAHCASCHGSEGHGPANNKIVNGYAPSINNPQFLAAADDGFLLATIALGRPGTPMRSFARGSGGISDLSADEIKKIVAYIRSWEHQEE